MSEMDLLQFSINEAKKVSTIQDDRHDDTEGTEGFAAAIIQQLQSLQQLLSQKQMQHRQERYQWLQSNYICLRSQQLLLAQIIKLQKYLQRLQRTATEYNILEIKYTDLVQQNQELKADNQILSRQLGIAQTRITSIESDLEIQVRQQLEQDSQINLQGISPEMRRLTQENQILQTKNKILAREKENLVDEKDVLSRQLEVANEEKENLLQKTLKQTKLLNDFIRQQEKIAIFQDKLQIFAHNIHEDFALIRKLLQNEAKGDS